MTGIMFRPEQWSKFLPQSYKNIYTKLYVYQFDLQYKTQYISGVKTLILSAGYQGGGNTGFASCMLDVFVMPFVPEVFQMMYITLLHMEHLYNGPLLPLLRVPFLFGPPDLSECPASAGLFEPCLFVIT